ncbi:hypothetical protein CYMTET_22640 [Cymbomonas tetramitiformis]|uniref:Uncharacterized protein n=1 Tax=Cymbomonas tetramitiformis TaxID=36881 RepID=A0AAE0FZH5_9CHLO|nr:hypothetical protein CYMTET_30478 [Cymbomonas tetramitiformis]KAK3268886.1 hypothetical protein CYMTET_22640 [Cymbomonas tetramitiformis]
MGETFEPFSQEGCNTTLAAPPASSMPQSLVTLPELYSESVSEGSSDSNTGDSFDHFQSFLSCRNVVRDQEDSHQPKCARQLATRRKTRPAGRPAAQPAAGQETQRPRHANVTFSITCVSPLAPPARPMPPPPLRSAYQDLRSEHYSEGSSDSDTGDDGSQFQQRAADLERQQVVQQTRPAGRPAAQPAAGQETQRPRHANVTFSITCVSPLAPPARPMPPPPLRSAYQDLRSVHYSEGSSDSDTRDSWDYLLWSPSVLSDPEDSSDLDD